TTKVSSARSSGTTTRIQVVSVSRAAGLRSRTRRSAGRPGIRLRSTRPIRRDRAGTPMTAARVKKPPAPSGGSTSSSHPRGDRKKGGGRGGDPGGRAARGRRQHDPRVEVDAAGVGPDPSGRAQRVGVGDVGVEGRPDRVEARADDTGRGPAVAAGGGVTA